MPTYLLPDDQSSLIVQFDLIISESHESTADVTEHPVELGSNIADNVKQNPSTLTLEVHMTSTPIIPGGAAGGIVTPQVLEFPSYSPPFTPSPGAIFTALGNAVTALIQGIKGPPLPIVIQVLQFPNQTDPVQQTHTKLLDLWSRGQTMSVTTTDHSYDSMVLTNVSLPRKEPGGADFTLTFKHIQTVTTGTVTAPKPAQKRGVPAQPKGGQSTTDAGSGPKASAAKQLANRLLGLGGTNG